MKVTAISDLHGDMPKLKGGDLLIIAGDLTARDYYKQHVEFAEWLRAQDYRKKVLIAGNHDVLLYKTTIPTLRTEMPYLDASYLCDAGTEFEGYKIWGTPWTPYFNGVNPDCAAFMLRSNFQLKDKFDLIPEDTDILVSHGPCYGRLDRTLWGDDAGSPALRERVDYLRTKKLKYHIHGHIHEAYGEHEEGGLKTLNVARMDRNYIPKNKIVNFEIEDKQ